MKMKKLVLMIVPLIVFYSTTIIAQDTPQPATEEGEDLDLQGVATLFKESETLEEFEEKLNSEEAEVNNLDLNKDGEIDYLRVLESVEGSTHLIVVQATLGENAYQDVCTIEVDKDDDGNTYVQIVGDKSIYGDGYILEPPAEEQETVNKTAIVVVLIGPGYRPWRSPYRWGRYPPMFRPRPPIARSRYRSRMSSRYPKKGRWGHSNKRKSRGATTMHKSSRKSSSKAKTTQRKGKSSPNRKN
jgi:hypothetical protein